MPKKRQILKYNHDKIIQAVDAVKSGSMSIRTASTSFGVPRSTIGDKLSGRSNLDTNIGRKPALPSEVENKIIDTVLEASKRGMGLSRKQLFSRTGILCKRMKVVAFTGKNGEPGRGWWSGVKKRHPEVTIRKPEKLGNSRARMLNHTIVSRYMADLGKIITDLNLHHKPQFIWNCDETGKQFQHTPVKVISQRGARNVVSRVSENRTNITIMACVNGAGEKMVPMVIVKGKTSASLHGFNVREAPEGTVFAYQESGWMNEELGERWFRDVFLKQCGPERPQLLLLDGHSSHETLGLLELAIKENIQILCMPPHTTHMLQPLDRTVFGPFNSAYNAACSQFLSESPYHIVNKSSFPGLFKTAWERSVTQENVVNGFKACGIVPFDPNAIPSDAFNPAAATEKPASTNIPAATGVVPTADAESLPLTDVNEPVTPVLSNIQLLATAASTAQKASLELVHPSSTNQPSPKSSESLSLEIPAFSDNKADDSFSVDDPELLLSLITSGQIEIVSADSDGVASFPIQTDPLDTKYNQPSAAVNATVDIDSVWNNAVKSIFVPSTSKENVPPKKSKAKTTHRLLTAQDVIAEKKEQQVKKDLKQLKTLRKAMKQKQTSK